MWGEKGVGGKGKKKCKRWKEKENGRIDDF